MRTLVILIITVLVLLLCIGGVIFFVSPKNTTLTAKEKNAALATMLGRTPLLTEKIRNNGFIQYDGKYLTFVYPAAAQKYLYGEKPDAKTVLESFEFQETDAPRYHFVMQVETFPTTSLQYDDVSGVRLRRLQSTIYTESSLSSLVGKWVLFVKKDDMFEKIAFLVKNGKLFTFSVTGSDSVIEKIFDKVIASIRIK